MFHGQLPLWLLKAESQCTVNTTLSVEPTQHQNGNVRPTTTKSPSPRWSKYYATARLKVTPPMRPKHRTHYDRRDVHANVAPVPAMPVKPLSPVQMLSYPPYDAPELAYLAPEAKKSTSLVDIGVEFPVPYSALAFIFSYSFPLKATYQL